MMAAIAVPARAKQTAAGKLTLHFTVPFPPSLNNLFFNSKRGGRGITPRYKAWRDEAGYRLNQQRVTPLHGPVSVSIILPDKGRCDLDGLAKAILDLAVSHGLIDGDGPKVVRSLNLAWGETEEVLVTMVRAAT